MEELVITRVFTTKNDRGEIVAWTQVLRYEYDRAEDVADVLAFAAGQAIEGGMMETR